jgi:hypothetical protein
MLLVESSNLLLILASNTILDVALNFVALAVIAEFDDIYYATISDHPIEKWMGENDDGND